MLEDIFDLGDSVVFLTYPLPQLRPLMVGTTYSERHVMFEGVVCSSFILCRTLYVHGLSNFI